jgi:hypothetical protein
MSTLDEAGLPGVFQGFYAGEVQDPWRLASSIAGQQGPRGPAAVGIKLAFTIAILFLSMRKTSKMAATEMRMQFVEPAAMVVKSCLQLSKGDS